MKAYIWQADIYCEDCGNELVRRRIPMEDTGDSDDFPQGPYPDGGGEADVPQHCGNGSECINAITLKVVGHNTRFRVGVPLDNPLTHDGELYVRDVVASREGLCWRLWRELYRDYLQF